VASTVGLEHDVEENVTGERITRQTVIVTFIITVFDYFMLPPLVCLLSSSLLRWT